MFSERIFTRAPFVLGVIFATFLGITASAPAFAAGVVTIGSGECVQQGTGVTGSVVREGNYCLVAVKSGSGSWIVPNGVKTVDFLIAGGGGGGGGSSQSGGGGAGAFYVGESVALAAGVAIDSTVGAGGAVGSAAGQAGAAGNSTLFGGVTAFGGGGGSSTGQASGDVVGRSASPGGSGGGDVASPVGVAKTFTNQVSVITDFGDSIVAGTEGVGLRNAGGRAKGVFQNFTGQNTAVSFWIGGGGGGAGAAGGDMLWISDGTFAGSGLRPGDGGIGVASSLLSPASATTLGIGQVSGDTVYFAGGGRGRANFDSVSWNGYLSFSPYSLGGSAGLGSGTNTGGGGGGAAAGNAGVILIRYVIPQVISLVATSSSDSEVELDWTSPSGTETITGFMVEKSLRGVDSWSLAGTTPDVSTSLANSTTVTGLEAATEYDFRVTPIFASGDGVVSPVVFAKTALPTQTVSWAPSNTNVVFGSSPVNPDSLATTSGDGEISYSVQSAGTTACAVNPTSGALTFSASGTCVIRATAAESASYAEGYRDVTFTVLPASTAVTIDLQAAIGDSITGAGVEFIATGMSPNTAWSLVVRSTPQTLSSGLVPSAGFVLDAVNLPGGLSAGWHSLTWAGTGVQGNTVLTSLWFEVSETGLLVETRSTPPDTDNPGESVSAGQVVASSLGSLASTGAGFFLNGISWGIALFIVGLVLFFIARWVRNDVSKIIR